MNRSTNRVKTCATVAGRNPLVEGQPMVQMSSRGLHLQARREIVVGEPKEITRNEPQARKHEHSHPKMCVVTKCCDAVGGVYWFGQHKRE